MHLQTKTKTNREMKVTKEHKKQIRIGTRAIGDNPTHRHLFQKGAEWAIEKFGGIQWNKYPDTKPTEDGYYLLWDENGPVEDMHVAYVFVHNPEERLSGSTHWAEINLPNK